VSWQRIAPDAAAELIAARLPAVVDIRDPQSYGAGHIPGAVHLDGQSAPEFLAATEKTRPVIVCCYHGFSSQGAAGWLVAQGFTEVYSLDGGFEGWRWNNPVES
jgi:thiosulfate sulfurtransferase